MATDVDPLQEREEVKYTDRDYEDLRSILFVSAAEVFYPIYVYLFAKRERFVQNFERTLKAANFSTTSHLYLSATTGAGLTVGTIVGLATMFVSWTAIQMGLLSAPSFSVGGLSALPEQLVVLYVSIRPILFVAVLTVSSALLGLVFGGIISIAIPYLRARERAKAIDVVFPDALAMMFSLTEGGMNQIEIFKELADSEDVYGELSVEFQRIVRQTEMFGRDYDSAIQEVAQTTPSDELSRFLNDMAAVLNQGGAFRSFLKEQHDVVLGSRESDQESRMRALETFGQIYVTVLILPMLLLIVLVIMAMTGSPRPDLLFLTVYVVEPALNIGFFIFISTIKLDDPGTGTMEYNGLTPLGKYGHTSFRTPVAGVFKLVDSRFSSIHRQELRYRFWNILTNPFEASRRNPGWIAGLSTIPAVAVLAVFIRSGFITPSVDALVAHSFIYTTALVVVPFLMIATPYVIFYEWGTRRKQRVTDGIHEDIRKLANMNDTGTPLHEAIRTTAQEKDTAFSRELGMVYRKLKMGVPLQRGLVEMNNKFQLPSLSRKLKIIEKASGVSADIADVLYTAADLAAVEADLERERYVRTSMQVVILEVSFLVFLLIIAALDSTLIEMVNSIIGDDPAWPNFKNIDPDLLSLLFYHAVLIQGSLSGVVVGYVNSGNVRDGVKIMYVNVVLTVVVWVAIILFF
jgi:flagellar protein FlaJ